MNTNEQRYYTKREASVYLRRSQRFLDLLRERGKLNAYYAGRRLLFRRQDLDDYVLQCAWATNDAYFLTCDAATADDKRKHERPTVISSEAFLTVPADESGRKEHSL